MYEVMRTVRLDPAAEESKNVSDAEFERFDEVYRGLEWLLCRDPERGVSLNGNVRVCFHQAEWASSPGILAVFSHTDDLVVIFDFKAILKTDE